MRRIAGIVVIMAAATSTATAQQTAPPRRQAPAQPAAGKAANAMAAPVPDPAAMDALLTQWAQQNGTLKSLDVSFIRTDVDKAWGDKTEFVGNAYLQSPNLACLHYKKVDRTDPKAPKTADHERIVCTGQEVRQYDYRSKQIFVFPLDRDQRKRAMQEGPLPFLFNLNAAEAKERWSMSLMDQDQNYYLIGIKPRKQADLAVFSQAFLQLDKKTFLPNRMLLVDTNGKDTMDYQFKQVNSNRAIPAQFFQGMDIKGWKVVFNPGADNQPAQAGAAAQPPPPRGRPRMGARQPAGAQPPR